MPKNKKKLITKDELIYELSAIAKLDPKSLNNEKWDHTMLTSSERKAIAKLEIIKSDSDTRYKIVFYDKLDVIKELAKLISDENNNLQQISLNFIE